MDVGQRKRIRAGSLFHEIALEYLRAAGKIRRRVLRVKHAQQCRRRRPGNAGQQAHRRNGRHPDALPYHVLFHTVFLSSGKIRQQTFWNYTAFVPKMHYPKSEQHYLF